MKSFGNYAICDPIVHPLAKDPSWTWTINPPTSGDELSMQRFLLQGRIEVSDGVRRDFPPTNTEICHRELALTFGGTTIPADIDKPLADGGKPVIAEGAKIETIEAVLRSMPHALVLELWDALADAVVGWGPARPKAPKTSSD